MTSAIIDRLFTDPAPQPWIAFLLGAIFSVLGIFLWVCRVRKTSRDLAAKRIPFQGAGLRIRAMISAAVDTDEPLYTIVKMCAQSFLFLGGLQINYRLTLFVMLGWFAVESSADSIRVLIAVSEAKSLKELVVFSSAMRSQLRNPTTTLEPHNVYEDMGHSKVVLWLVFLTQAILIAFVVADVFGSNSATCPTGTGTCPFLSTLAAWVFYLLGILMACVFLIGPKTSFGQSVQNPAFWLQLLLAAKQTGATISWYDPVKDKTYSTNLRPDDLTLWIRFAMSFLMNGVGFHILIHALPIQVAAQTSLLGLVFRAVGMMYLVDLDDTVGYPITVVEKSMPDDKTEEEEDQDDGKDEDMKQENAVETPATSPDSQTESFRADETASEQQDHEYRPGSEEQDTFQAAVDNILAEARIKLDALARDPSSAPTILGSPPGTLYPRRNAGAKWTAALALAGAYGTTLGGSNRGSGDNNQGGQGQGPSGGGNAV